MELNRHQHEPVRCVAFILLLAAMMWIAGCDGHRNQKTGPGTVPEVKTVTLRSIPVELTTELPGRTTAYGVAQIRPQVNGIIQKRLFKEGANVKAGQLLYQINPAPFQAALNSAEASLSMAKANIPAIRSRAERYRTLLAQNAVSHQDYDDAAAAMEKAKAQIDYWRAEVEKACINLNYTRVTAPISGRISRSNVTDGALVTAYQAIALSTIQQLDPIYVDVTQSTSDLLDLRRKLASGKLRNDNADGHTVTIRMEDGTPYPLHGILQFRDMTSVDPATGSYILRIVVPNPENLLLPSMFVRAIIKEGTAERAILVPHDGVTRNPKGEAIAWIVDEKSVVQERQLSIDRAIGNDWLIIEGLSAGDRVITEGRLNVKPGTAVRIAEVNRKPDTTETNPTAKPKPVESTN